MFEKFLSGNIETFRQRYEGTYGFYRDEKNKRLLVRLDGVSPHRCDFVDANGITYQMVPDSPRDIGFEFLPPKSAWYNTKDGAVNCQRMATRQWSRGVTSKTVDLRLLVKGDLFPIRVDFGTLSSIYEDPIAPQEAMLHFEKGRSVALSSSFAIEPGGVTYVLREPIGTVAKKGKTLVFKLTEPDLWRTEITDALRAIGHTAEIS